MPDYWDRIVRQRVSRRRALAAAGTGAAGIAALALAGCGDSDGAPPEGGTGTSSATSPDGAEVLNPGGPPRHGGTLVTANAATFDTFDPHLGIAVSSAYFPRVYNVLVNQSATRPEFIFLDLARSYEVPDDNTFIFKIRPGVRIGPNDLGVPERDLDGEDVRVTLERIGAEPSANNHAFVRDHIDAVTVAGDTVTITTPGPYAWFLNRIGLFLNAIAPRELMTGDLARLQTQAAGAGPYRLRSLTENERARFERNPNYYRTDPANNGARLPYADALEVGVIFDRATLRTAFESGQIDQFITGSGAEARALSDAVVSRDPYFAYISFTMNSDRKPFDDPRVRRAVSRAIDRREFVDVVYRGDARPNGLVQWSLGSYALPEDQLATRYQPFDPDEAKRLVDEVGGIKLKMIYPAETTILEHSLHLPVFVRQMQAAGIEVEHVPQDFGRWIESYRALDYDCSLALNQMYETPEIPLGFHSAKGPLGDGTYVRGIGDAEIESAVVKASRQLDMDARVAAVHDAQKVIYAKDPAHFPLVTPYNHIAYNKRIRNIPTGIGTSAFLVNTWWLDG